MRVDVYNKCNMQYFADNMGFINGKYEYVYAAIAAGRNRRAGQQPVNHWWRARSSSGSSPVLSGGYVISQPTALLRARWVRNYDGAPSIAARMRPTIMLIRERVQKLYVYVFNSRFS